MQTTRFQTRYYGHFDLYMRQNLEEIVNTVHITVRCKYLTLSFSHYVQKEIIIYKMYSRHQEGSQAT